MVGLYKSVMLKCYQYVSVTYTVVFTNTNRILNTVSIQNVTLNKKGLPLLFILQ